MINIKLLKIFHYHIALIVSLLLVGKLELCSQNNPILNGFSAFEFNGKVHLIWTIKTGSTCNGIQIYRSMDNLHFSEIGVIGGVCGNISSPITYTYTDDQPIKNKINYYRLNLGGIGFS